MVTPYAVIDLLAVLPFYLPFLIPVDPRVLRILLLFKLGRYSTAFEVVERVVRRKWGQLFVAVFVSFVLLIVVSTLTNAVEHEAQLAAFPSILGTMYWAWRRSPCPGTATSSRTPPPGGSWPPSPR